MLAANDGGFGPGATPVPKPKPTPAKREPPKHLVLYFYSRIPVDINVSEAQSQAKALASYAPRIRQDIAIESLEEIFAILQLMANQIGSQTKEKVPPFVSEIHILGHGKPGEFNIGSKSYDSTYFKKLAKGRAEEYLEDNAAIFLDGCLAGSDAVGKEFLYQIGRVFFGNKRGSITANTGVVVPVINRESGKMGSTKPVTLRYPENVLAPAK